jgi:AGCS family alanine or glycine:cation symporter
MLEILLDFNARLNSLVWGPPMLALIVGAGIIFTVVARFVQFARLGQAFREVAGWRRAADGQGDIAPFKAMSVAMAGTVGVGNIAGVATAIALGGPGALFWMWVSGLLGMATKLFEVILGVHYRARDAEGQIIGGPMQYITRGLGPSWKWMAVVFCVFGAFSAFGIGNMVQANSVAAGLARYGVPLWVTGAVLIVLVGLVTIGGLRRIAQVASVIVPFMIALYMLGSLGILVTRLGQLPEALALIFRHAFTPAAPIGGFAGASVLMAMRYGIARGVFSNEAGLGSAPMAHAAAQTDHPARQGLWGIFEVFVDTIVICSATGLAIVLTGVWTGGATGAALTMEAFKSIFGGVGGVIVVIAMALTAYDTALAWCYYGETCVSYLGGPRARMPYRVLFLPFLLVGAMGRLPAIWDIADTLNGLMAIPNLIALLALIGVAVKLLRDFQRGAAWQPPAD